MAISCVDREAVPVPPTAASPAPWLQGGVQSPTKDQRSVPQPRGSCLGGCALDTEPQRKGSTVHLAVQFEGWCDHRGHLDAGHHIPTAFSARNPAQQELFAMSCPAAWDLRLSQTWAEGKCAGHPFDPLFLCSFSLHSGGVGLNLNRQ